MLKDLRHTRKIFIRFHYSLLDKKINKDIA